MLKTCFWSVEKEHLFNTWIVLQGERMDFIVVEQIWAIGMILFGVFILNTCSRLERDERKIASDPRNRFGKNKSDKAKPKNIRGNIMTIAGTLLCIGGMVLFLIHVKL
jgi:hypothetical protein